MTHSVALVATTRYVMTYEGIDRDAAVEELRAQMMRNLADVEHSGVAMTNGTIGEWMAYPEMSELTLTVTP